MKKIVLCLFVIFLLQVQVLTQVINTSSNQEETRKIQLAILFDTSGSMDGLLDQAKSKIWSIVNTLADLRYEDQQPQIEIALYRYGHSALSEKDNYIEQLSGFSSDLDNISSKLFGLTTNGGDEFCGAVIERSIDELSWSQNGRDIKLVYIAGNEPFDQGKNDYKMVCAKAFSRDIYVNTIYCGNHDRGITELWQDGADIGHGKYFSIDSDQKVRFIATPYDDSIRKLNNTLNTTYIGYGCKGNQRIIQQKKEDKNAESMNEANLVERAKSKSSKIYTNEAWDLVDYVGEDIEKLKTIPKSDLPIEMRTNSFEDNMELIKFQKEARKEIQKSIQVLIKKRDQYIKNTSDGDQDDDFGKAVSRSIESFAEQKNYIRRK